jgi:hypothetical protein
MSSIIPIIAASVDVNVNANIFGLNCMLKSIIDDATNPISMLNPHISGISGLLGLCTSIPMMPNLRISFIISGVTANVIVNEAIKAIGIIVSYL